MKNIYWQVREALDLTREAASEVLETMSPERINRIEREECLPRPDEVLLMARKYKKPELCNYHCSRECPIGQEYVPEVRSKNLPENVLEMLASLNSVQDQTEELIRISADGMIGDSELQTFVEIQRELERISVAVEGLQLWSERMLASGKIDMNKYRALLSK